MYCVDIIYLLFVTFFFFKQKTAYEMRISDWSSDVCSSDLSAPLRRTAQVNKALYLFCPAVGNLPELNHGHCARTCQPTAVLQGPRPAFERRSRRFPRPPARQRRISGWPACDPADVGRIRIGVPLFPDRLFGGRQSRSARADGP